MGSFNVGPDIPEHQIEGNWVDHHDLIVDDGFVSANILSDNPRPTRSKDNLISASIATDKDTLCSNVFVKNAETSNPQILLDDPFTVEFDGDLVDVNHSGHYAY